MSATVRDTVLERLEKLNAIGTALSAEKNLDRLLEMILLGAKEITRADGGTLYTVTDDRTLKFEIIRTDSLNFAMGGTSGAAIPFPPIPMYDQDGRPNTKTVVTNAAITGKIINIPDAYNDQGYDFSGTRAFDAKTGYRSQSFLTIPLRNHEDDIIGVLQLINALDPVSGGIIPFSEDDQRLAASLASQAAVALTNRRLIDDLKRLFESFIHLIATAIDDKSPYTGGHCRRVPVITLMLADAATQTAHGPLAGFRMNEKERYELEIAAWLHDCGKVTTPEYVVDKATKLETIYDRLHEVETRFEVLKRDAELSYERARAERIAQDPRAPCDDLKAGLAARLKRLDEDRAFIRRCNVGGEVMSEDDQQRVRDIARDNQWVNPQGALVPLLTEEEIYNLCIQRGTLTSEEREKINHHIVATIKMLESLPFPKDLKNVPEFAGGHHERMDGKGYPRGLTREQMSVQARVMAIADIFEALTAKDRPYKKGKTLSESLRIMGFMCKEQHIDPDLFDIFVRERVYRRYAEEYLSPEQIDAVDHSKIPAYRGDAA